MLDPAAGLRPTRRLKRPVHQDDHRRVVSELAEVMSIQVPHALHNGGRLGAAPQRPERTWSRRTGMWR